MLKNKEIRSHLVVTLIYFLIVSVLRFKFDWTLIGLWTGAAVGTFFLDIDHLVFWLVTHPERPDSIEAKRILGLTGLKPKVKLMQLFGLLENSHLSHNRLIFHSIVGQVILFILGIFVLTSGGSIFSSAFVMAANLHLLKDEWTDFQQNKDHLSDWLFWQVREASLKDYLVEYLVVATLFFIGLSKLLL